MLLEKCLCFLCFMGCWFLVEGRRGVSTLLREWIFVILFHPIIPRTYIAVFRSCSISQVDQTIANSQYLYPHPSENFYASPTRFSCLIDRTTLEVDGIPAEESRGSHDTG